MDSHCSQVVATALLILPVLWVGTASAAGLPDYVGTWGTSTAECKAGETVVKLKHRAVGMVDAECTFRSVSGGNGVWRVRARCQGDGIKPNETLMLWANRSRLTMVYDGDSRRWNYQRC